MTYEICNGCNGSGEGSYDGSSCMTCGGGGELYYDDDDDDDRLEAEAENAAEEAAEAQRFRDEHDDQLWSNRRYPNDWEGDWEGD